MKLFEARVNVIVITSNQDNHKMGFALPLLRIPSGYTNEQTGCPLFRLPPEIREVIYTCCCTLADAIENLHFSDYPHCPWRKDLGIAVMRTCRRVYSEFDVRPLYSNRFIFTYPHYLMKFAQSLSPVQ